MSAARAAKRVPLVVTSCHCGDAGFELFRRPRGLTRCNCSICRRYGTLWAYFTWKSVRLVEKRKGALVGYARRRAKAALDFFHCRRCGCVTHWEHDGRKPERRIGVNMRLVDDPAVLEGQPVHWLDGAGGWKTIEDANWP